MESCGLEVMFGSVNWDTTASHTVPTCGEYTPLTPTHNLHMHMCSRSVCRLSKHRFIIRRSSDQMCCLDEPRYLFGNGTYTRKTIAS